MNEVVCLAEFQCPVGSMAMHPTPHAWHGMVEIFAQDGWMRGVLYEHPVELSLADEAEEGVVPGSIEIRETWVHVRELAEASLAKDIKNLR